jgi:hypothetical protein
LGSDGTDGDKECAVHSTAKEEDFLADFLNEYFVCGIETWGGGRHFGILFLAAVFDGCVRGQLVLLCGK